MTTDRPRSRSPSCLLCGEPERIELWEMWSSHEFALETCCEGLHDAIARDIVDDPDWGRSLLRQLGAEEIMGRPLRRVADDGACGLLLDWQLDIRDVTFATARGFIARHHAHCNPPVTWRFGAAIWNGGTRLGVVTVGNPVARGLCGQGVLEVNRLCIRRDVPRALAWNAASMLYGWSAREALRRGWSRIVTYTRVDEDGTSLRAAGWTQEARTRGRGWHSARRARGNRNAFIDKVRWGRDLHPQRYPRPQAPAIDRSFVADAGQGSGSQQVSLTQTEPDATAKLFDRITRISEVDQRARSQEGASNQHRGAARATTSIGHSK